MATGAPAFARRHGDRAVDAVVAGFLVMVRAAGAVLSVGWTQAGARSKDIEVRSVPGHGGGDRGAAPMAAVLNLSQAVAS